ncbi:type I polyketide synthase [Virgisporangium aurantiacum]|uniref:Acyl transferase domain-containing protein n=1 Tax=Virgisporangium aurantiacum TaxID=175570 RepID=A0A8J3ZE32_9ACTN|nr:type I polyketide synthase [Virgisporangium aurantiacum]GIJ62221.1 hypothetical protein Vau01_097370 [Virgisporangium aurantiacum]
MTPPLEPIAIVGMSARMPQAVDLDRYWQNLVDGRECVTDLTAEELRDRGETAARRDHPGYVSRCPILPGMEDFDADFFGMTPREAELRDPQHRLFLEACHGVLENAGYDPDGFPGDIGVFASGNVNRYLDLHLRRHPTLAHAVGELAIETGNHPSYLSSFASYKLGLRGPSLTVATACSSSLVAVHLASQALRAGECDLAIAGGVQVEWPYGVGYIHLPGGILSADGRCRPFDADASGTISGNGVGAVLLKRLSDAVADRDSIYAVVAGSAVNNDGSSKVAFSAPSVAGQAACIVNALDASGLTPADISYVEAHGTATAIGDLIEMKALAEAFGAFPADLPEGGCRIGSVKSNIGHLGAAAGIAGLIKTVLALHHGRLPATVNFSRPNPDLKLPDTPFTVQDALTPWPDSGRSRHAGVSSFGIGGTNAHVVLSAAPDRPARPAADERPRLLLTSAHTPEALASSHQRLLAHLASAEHDPRDVVRTLATGRRTLRWRGAMVLDPAPGPVTTGADPGDARSPGLLAFMFPGQGSQVVRMGAGLHRWNDAFRETFDTRLPVVSDLLGVDLRRLWTDGTPAELGETAVSQALVYLVEVSAVAALRAAGVTPDIVMGHSLGEIAAAETASVFTADDALRLVAERAAAMADAPRGRMLAVSASAGEVADLIRDGVALAAVNSDRQVVLTGGEEAMARLGERLAAEGRAGRWLPTSHGYHSELMAPAAARVRQFLRSRTISAPAVEFVSTVTARVENGDLSTPDYWADQMLRPVRFAGAVDTLAGRDTVTLIEVGPGDTLTRLVRAARRKRLRAVPLLPRSSDTAAEFAGYLAALGALWRAGHPLDRASLVEADSFRVALPGVPLIRRRAFVDPPGEDPESRAESRAEPQNEPQSELPVAVAGPPAPAGPTVHEVTWTGVPPSGADLARPPRVFQPRPALALLSGDRAADDLLVTALQRAGYRPALVYPRGAGTRGAHTVDVTDRDAVFALVEELARTRRLPATAVHGPLMSTQPDHDTDLRRGTYALLWLVQAVQRWRAEAGLTEWRLVVLTRHGADVTGSEPLSPARAMVSGLLHTLALETESVHCGLIDVGDRVTRDQLAACLAATAPEGLPQIAVRPGGVWAPALRPLALDADRRAVPGGLRHRGVYLITGGLGGLGAAAARAIAGTGTQPRLALLGRTAGASPADLDLVDELAAAGADVRQYAADVADPGQLAAAVEDLRTRFGPVNGVLHAAGVAGGGLLELRTAAQVDAVIRPKVDGARNLHRLLAGHDLDFVLHFGSRAALTGLAGSGDYAAANAFLNAFAARQAGTDTRVTTVNWPSWAEVGMAARSARPVDAAAEVRRTLTGQEWFLAEHRVDGRPVLPGAAYVDLVLGAAAQRLARADGAATVIRDLVLLSPLAVPAPTVVAVELRPARDGHRDGHRAVVRSRPADRPEWAEWTEHATCTVAGSDEEPAHRDLGDLYDRLRDGVGERPTTSGLVDFGPHWSNVVRAATSPDEAVLELSLPDDYRDEVDAHPSHPALLDNATSVIRPSGAAPMLPYLYAEAVFFRTVPADVVVVARRRPDAPGGTCRGDVDLYDRRGRQVARITGFTMRATDPAAVARQQAPDPTSGRDWLSVEEGTALLLRLMHADLPAAVAVGGADGEVAPRGRRPLAGRSGGRPPGPGDRPTPTAAAPVAVAAAAASPQTVPPAGGDTEQRLRTLWADIIGRVEFGSDDDFFDVGGDSVAVVQLVARIRETFGVELGVGAVFESSTLRTLTDELERLTGR